MSVWGEHERCEDSKLPPTNPDNTLPTSAVKRLMYGMEGHEDPPIETE